MSKKSLFKSFFSPDAAFPSNRSLSRDSTSSLEYSAPSSPFPPHESDAESSARWSDYFYPLSIDQVFPPNASSVANSSSFSENASHSFLDPGHGGGYPLSEYQRKDWPIVNMQSIAIPPISVDELRDITDNYGSEALIGEGSYGRMYYGVLRCGKAVAIKKLASSRQPDEEFLAQVSMVSSLKHENLVGLLGYYIDGGFRVLAYEYAPYGSLHDILHDSFTNIHKESQHQKCGKNQ